MVAIKIAIALALLIVVLLTVAIEWLRAKIREQRRGSKRPGAR